ncbi:hypothetical protein [Pulveribacter sp.]|uniref:hypothetical protein n=1 Tax=Pulveribacter sp. TaxID=2678893 RepID=UPI0028AE4133|nr:hypothetical protein [Pulveribacter sp.]
MALDPKIRRFLEAREAKYGLADVQRGLDEGWFSHDPELHRQCRAWVTARKAGPWIQAIWKLLLGVSAIVAAVAALITALK